MTAGAGAVTQADVARIFGTPRPLPAPATDKESVEAIVEKLEELRDGLDRQIEELRVTFEIAMGDKAEESQRLTVAISALKGEELPAAKPRRRQRREAAPGPTPKPEKAKAPIVPRPGSLSEVILDYLRHYGQTPGRVITTKLVERGKAKDHAGVASALHRLTEAGNVEKVFVDGDSARIAYRLPGQDETSSTGA